MGINIITRSMVTMFVIGIIYITFMPVIYLVSQQGFILSGVTLDPRGQYIVDNAYTIYQASGIIYIAGCIVWMFNASDRKSVSHGYE